MADIVIPVDRSSAEIIDEAFGVVPSSAYSVGDDLLFSFAAKRVLSITLISDGGEMFEYVGGVDLDSLVFELDTNSELKYHIVYERGSTDGSFLTITTEAAGPPVSVILDQEGNPLLDQLGNPILDQS